MGTNSLHVSRKYVFRSWSLTRHTDLPSTLQTSTKDYAASATTQLFWQSVVWRDSGKWRTLWFNGGTWLFRWPTREIHDLFQWVNGTAPWIFLPCLPSHAGLHKGAEIMETTPFYNGMDLYFFVNHPGTSQVKAERKAYWRQGWEEFRETSEDEEYYILYWN